VTPAPSQLRAPALADAVPAAPAPVPAAPAAGGAGFGLYGAHLLTTASIALSNALLGLTLLSLPWTLRSRPISWAPLAPLTVPLGLYVLWLAGSIAGSYDPRVSLRAASEVFSLCTLLLAPLLVRDERAVRRLVDGLIAVAALLAVWGLAQVLWGYGDLDHRIRGPFSHYMTFAGFLLICDLLLAAQLAFGRGVQGRWWRWAALLAINLALLGSLTRSAWVALAVALLALVGAWRPRLLPLFPVAALLFLVVAPVPLVHRAVSIADLRDTSNYDRVCMLAAGGSMIAERPLFGLGPDMVERRYPLYRPPTAPRYQVPHLHNSFVQLAAERGLPALAAYLALTGASAWTAWRQLRREGGRRGPRADLYAGVLLALLAFNVAGLFENNWGDTEVQRPLLFALALPYCLRLARHGGCTPQPVAAEPAEALPAAAVAEHRRAG
jgi:putative inorganic carbon (HCO3(-)) transporter